SYHDSYRLPHLHSFPTRRSSDLPKVPHYSDASHRQKDSKGLPNLFVKPCFANLLDDNGIGLLQGNQLGTAARRGHPYPTDYPARSEEHTSELQSRGHLVCRLLLE